MPTAAKKAAPVVDIDADLTPEEFERWKRENAAKLKPSRHAGRPVALAVMRKACGLSQAEVAARMGVAQSHVSKIEAGADVMVSTLQKYVEALGMKLDVHAKKSGGSWRLKVTE